MELNKIVEYDPLIGLFKWKRSGTKAGCVNSQGYNQIGINGKIYRSARLAWYFVYGYWPREIDHINRNRQDDRLSNLREVNRAENNMNSKARNASGEKNISKLAGNGGWHVKLTRNSKTIHLGTFPSLEEAIEVRDKYLETLDVLQ